LRRAREARQDEDARMAETVQLGLIGCGIISGAHMDAVARVPGATVVAASNHTEARLNATADKYGIPRRYRDWRDLIADEAIQGVIICLPEGLHEPVAVEAARHGKHILVEKPMGRNLAETDSMIAAARDAGVRLMVAQVLRRFPNHVPARQWIAEGKIGRVARVVRRRLMNNVLPDPKQRPWASDPALAADWLLYGFGSHEFDAVLWLLDSEADTVVAQGRRGSPQWPGWDWISATVTLRNGAVAEVTICLSAEDRVWDTVLTGSLGTIAIRNNKVVLNGVETEVPGSGESAFEAQMAEFVDCIREDKEPGPSGRNVRATMALLEGVKRSLEEKRPVRMEEFAPT
jgi:predicted dehydrogenase